MTRSRTLRPGFFSSFNLAKVSRDARLFFAGLWVEADDEGRLIDSPKQLAGAIFPHDDDVDAPMVVGWLDDLIAITVVARYEANGGRYLVIPNFMEHQKPPHASPSKLPPIPGKPVKASRVTREKGVRASRKRSEDAPPDDGDPSEALTPKAALGLGLGSCLGSSSSPTTADTHAKRVPSLEDEDQPAQPKIVADAVAILARRALDTTPSAVGDVPSWLAKTQRQRLEFHQATISDLRLENFHDGAALANWLEPPAATEDSRADLALMDRTLCPACESTNGWMRDIEPALPCPVCRPEDAAKYAEKPEYAAVYAEAAAS